MKIIVFSDIHGNVNALKSFINQLAYLSYDKILFLGDIFGYYYHQKECIQLLASIPDLVWIKGNHDVYAVNAFAGKADVIYLIQEYGHSYDNLKERFSDDEISVIDRLDPFYVINICNKRVGFFHGRPDNPLEGRIYKDSDVDKAEVSEYDFVFIGHTHCKIDRMVGHTRLLSPGSLGQPRDGKGYGFIVYDFDTNACDFINVDVDNAILKEEIDNNDKHLKKLYDVLEREDDAWRK